MVASQDPLAAPLAALARHIVHRQVCQEIDQDLDVWTYKTYLDKPLLAKGDGLGHHVFRERIVGKATG